MPTKTTTIQSVEFDVSQGFNGMRFIDSGFSPVSGEKYSGFIPKGGDATVTFTNDRGGEDASGEAFDKGVYVPGLFSVLTVSSGTVIAFIAPDNA